MSQFINPMLMAGESQALEFKASFDKAAIESLVAFANAQGGKVLVGVSDSGKVTGVTLGRRGYGDVYTAWQPERGGFPSSHPSSQAAT